MEPKVTVIVPVYNAEEYLNRCVDSILNQEYEDLELILVNDGSTDRSGEICQAYEAKDPRVILLTKENSGVSDSRNLAIRQEKLFYRSSCFHPPQELDKSPLLWHYISRKEKSTKAYPPVGGCVFLLTGQFQDRRAGKGTG